MKRYKILVAYDGTDFAGWQEQKNSRTIVSTLCDSFLKTFDKKVTILGASRTDSGVHALGQVAIFQTDLALEVNTIQRAWNNILPESIVIRTLEEVDLSFNPHYNVESKTYWYHIFIQRPLPFFARYGWFCAYPIDIEKLKENLQLFVGTHDFRSFCTGDEMGENTVRTIDSITIEFLKRFNAYRISVTGKRFMHHMIRRIVGACVDIASRKQIPVHYLKEILKEKNPNQALLNAPAKGLLLYKIRYSK